MKTAVITGANRGIGLAMATQLSQQGWEIIGVCRSDSDELEAIAGMVISGIDVTEPEHLQQVKKYSAIQKLIY